jgi:hypothetical protein
VGTHGLSESTKKIRPTNNSNKKEGFSRSPLFHYFACLAFLRACPTLTISPPQIITIPTTIIVIALPDILVYLPLLKSRVILWQVEDISIPLFRHKYETYKKSDNCYTPSRIYEEGSRIAFIVFFDICNRVLN